MLKPGPAKKLVIYVNETTQYEGRPAYQSLLRWLHDHGVAGATVTRAIAGYGSHGSYHVSKAFHLTDDVPMRVEVVDSAERIHEILPSVVDMVPSGLVEVQDTEVVMVGRLPGAARADESDHAAVPTIPTDPDAGD